MEDEDAENNVLERILAGTKDPTRLSFRILASITENFSEERKIGEGGFGVVYKGVLRNGSIAVKKIKMDSHTVNDRLFERELSSLLHINHENVVRFLGFCYEIFHVATKGTGPQNVRLRQTRERLLCFEYISNTSLDKYITDELRGLEWNKRIQIIKGVCRGLKYLHENKKIIHLDLKPKNILVDDDMEPKITDFGLARVAENSHTTVAFLTRGYCAPEYMKDGKPTLECDIYSLGVIIIELVTGCVPADKTEELSPYQVLRRWKWSYKWNKSARQLPLPAEQVTTCIEIAERCMDKEPKRRPSISEIITKFNEMENTSGDIVGVGLIRPSEDDMLGIQPLELRFGFEPNKQIPSRVEVKLTNETGNCVAFNIKAEFPLQCSTKRGIVQGSGGTCVVNITLQAQESTTLPSMPDKVIVQSTKVKEGLREEEITEHMFNHEAGEVVDKVNLTVVYDRAEEPQAEPNVPISKDDKIASSSSEDRRLNFHPPQKTLATNTRTYTYNQAINTQAVDVVAGAMGPLLPKLRKLLKLGHNLPWLQPREKKDMESLERQLKRMEATLSKVLQKQLDQLDTVEKHWADEVRELSYNIEDLVDGLLLCSEGSEPTTNKPDGFESLQETIKDVLDQAKELAVDHRPGLAGGSVVNSYNPRRKAYFNKDHKRLVGIDSTMHALLNRVIGRDDDMPKQKLKIISIFGDGGVGKTTLAKAVYDNLAAVFILKAFVTVGRNRDINWVLEDILLKLKGDQYADIHNRKWDDMQLTEELRRVLEKKRYLVVIDDIWDKKLWEDIEMALIDHKCGSKIITTSRIFQVAKNSEDCKLEPLSYQHSKELFYATLSSRGKVTRSLDEPEEQCTIEILKKCGGVPLAIITIASLLADKEEEDWPKVYKSIGFGHEHNEDVDNTRKILLFSYYDLPHYLKTCLLHVSTFPEDREIEKNTLVWRWVAEGFVQEEKEKTLFMVGERYFNELINRSLLQPVEGTSYTIHFCHVHDMVLDMICSVAKENFISTLLDTDEQDPCSERDKKYVRRLSIQKRDVKQQDLAKSCSPERLRSFSATQCRLVFDLMSLLPSFQVLRLLSIDHCYLTGNHSLQNIAGLHHLRYLGLSGTNIGELPMELGQFRFLQTLDLRGNALKALRQSVTLLRQLKCFRSEGTEMRLPDGMGKLTSLEELRLDNVLDSPNFVKELGNLTELRVLHIGTYMFGDSLNEALVQSLSRLKKIEELELCDGGRCKAPNWHGFLPSQRLHHLRLHNIRYSHGLPTWINPEFLPMLSHLNVHVESAKAQDLDVLGGFPELGSLCLFIGEDMIFPDAIAAGAFPKLQYYYMFSPLKYLPGAMPCLQSVEFHVDVKAYRDANMEINLDSLKYLPSLMRVHAQINCWDVTMREVKAAETAVRHAVNIHDKCPILVLEHIGSCIDKLKLSSNSDIQNVVLAKLRSRAIVQMQRDAEELDYEHIDPTDPEVISYHLKFKAELPSMIESVLDETLDEGLPSLVESILNEMLDECRQREAGASSSQQVISRNSNFGDLLPSMIKSTIKEIHYLGQLGASNPEQINSTDLEALKHDSDLKAVLTSIIKSKIDKYGSCASRSYMHRAALFIDKYGQQEAEINSGSSNIGAVWMKTLLESQMHEGKQGEAEKYNFEQIDSLDQEVISRNLNFKNEQPSVDEAMLNEILDQGLPYSVESVLNEMLDECRQREAGASSSKQVISHDSNFEGLLPSMIKSIIKENEGRHGNASNPEQINSTDLEIISHDSDLKAALTSVIKFRIDKSGQGEVEESNSEQIDSRDQEINSSSSNIGAVWMKTLLESQMYEGKQREAEKYNFEQIDSIKQEVISRNLNFRNEQPSIDESILDEILDQGLPYMVESVLNEMLDECRQREARASSSKQVISRDSNFEALLPSMIKSIIEENDGRQGKLSNPKQINSTDLEIISHDSDLKAALTSVIKFRIDKCGQGEAEESNSEQIGSTDQEINSGRSNTEVVRIKTLLVSQMYEGKQGEAEESNSEHINSIDPEINNNSSYFGLIWFKVVFVIEMLERRKQEEEFDFERMDSINQELLQPQLQSPEDRPAEVHQQHFRFPAVKPFGER